MSLTFVNTNLVETINGHPNTLLIPALSFVSPSTVAVNAILRLDLLRSDVQKAGRHGHVVVSFEDNLGNEHDSLDINLQDRLFDPSRDLSINVTMHNARGGATSLFSKTLDQLGYRCGTDKFGGAGGKAIIEMGGFAGQTVMCSQLFGINTGLPTGNRVFHRTLERGGHYKIEMPFVIA